MSGGYSQELWDLNHSQPKKNKLKILKCPCSHHDIVAKYDETHVEIAAKHGKGSMCIVVLDVVNGKLVERRGRTNG